MRCYEAFMKDTVSIKRIMKVSNNKQNLFKTFISEIAGIELSLKLKGTTELESNANKQIGDMWF